MIEGLLIERGQFGLRAIATGVWSNKLTAYVQESGIVELELNQGKGWAGDDVSFLADLPQLLTLEILKLNLASIEAIHHLTKLRLLKISTYCKTEIRFSSFPNLETCSLEWRPKAKSVFECTTLKSLFINRYNGKTTEAFKRLTNLESLKLLNAPIETLEGISKLDHLKELRLSNLRKLASLRGISHLTNLLSLRIQTCRSIKSLDEVSELSKLTLLTIDNCGPIATLQPLRGLSQLQLFSFSESTDIVDGELGLLEDMPNLTSVAFRDRPTYSHRSKDLARTMEARGVEQRSVKHS